MDISERDVTIKINNVEGRSEYRLDDDASYNACNLMEYNLCIDELNFMLKASVGLLFRIYQLDFTPSLSDFFLLNLLKHYLSNHLIFLYSLQVSK